MQAGAALAAQQRGEFQVEFATRAILESLRPFENRRVAELLAHAAAAADALAAVRPRLLLDAGRRVCGVLLPGQPGYDAAV